MRTLFSLLALGLVVSSPASSQLHLWERAYGVDTCREVAVAAVPTESGGSFIVGNQCNDRSGIDHRGWLYVVAVDETGSPQWQKTGDSLNVIEARGAVQRASGGLLIVGRAVQRVVPPHDAPRLYIATLSGDLLNESLVGDPGWDIQHATPLTDGGFILSGTQDQLLLLVRISPAGEVVWSHRYTMRGVEHLVGAPTATSDGGFVVSGALTYSGVAEYDAFLMKVDAAGNEAWWSVVGSGGFDRGCAVAQRSDGTYLIAMHGGQERTSDRGGVSFVHVSVNGVRVGSVSASDQAYNRIQSFVPAVDGGFIAVGSSGFSPTEMKLTLLKASANGELVWTWRVGVEGANYDGRAMTPLNDNAFLIVGSKDADAVASLVTERPPAAVDPIGPYDGPMDLR